MNTNVFNGVCTALVTPFLDSKVNYPLVNQLLQRQLSAGVKAVVLAGTTGESPTLSDREKVELFRTGKHFTGDRCTIIAGTGSNDTIHTIELSHAAQEAGADALLIVSPYYNKANNDGLYAHYCSVASAVKIPIIIYNVPSRTGIDIPVEVYRELSSVPNIAGVKEACTNITKIGEIRSSCPDSFHIWSGNDDQIVPVMSLGGKGVISVLSNIYPAEAVEMTSAALAGDYKKAASLQLKLLPFIKVLFREVNPIPVKYAMKHLGFDCGNCRLPLGSPSKETQLSIDSYFS